MEEFAPPPRRSASSTASTATACAAARAAPNGWLMMAAAMNGTAEFFDEDGQSTIDSARRDQGAAVLIDLYQDGAGAARQRQLGLQRDRRRLLFGHLRLPRPGPRRADRASPSGWTPTASPWRRCRRARRGKSFPTIGYAGWAVFDTLRAQGRGLVADRAPVQPGVEHDLGRARRRDPDPQGRRAGSATSRPSSSRAGSPS